MAVHIGNDWDTFFEIETKKDYYLELRRKIKYEYEHYTIYPEMENIFNAFKYTPLSNLKVVIIGQDPYHNKGEAHGLCFSVNKGIKIPPSLRNIYQELKSDIGCNIPNHGYLESWAKQGVLLINAVLTVRENLPTSHKNYGWENLIDNVIKYISKNLSNIVFILWGNYAQSKIPLINGNHKIIKSVHPSPLSASRGFFGSKPFSKTNDYLLNMGKEPINWEILE